MTSSMQLFNLNYFADLGTTLSIHQVSTNRISILALFCWLKINLCLLSLIRITDKIFKIVLSSNESFTAPIL